MKIYVAVGWALVLLRSEFGYQFDLCSLKWVNFGPILTSRDSIGNLRTRFYGIYEIFGFTCGVGMSAPKVLTVIIPSWLYKSLHAVHWFAKGFHNTRCSFLITCLCSLRTACFWVRDSMLDCIALYRPLMWFVRDKVDNCDQVEIHMDGQTIM